ncbi:MAG: iron ABC transporter permease [Acidobacteriales bacterium]|nr:iron ABC transporter permease [Terriglobales bacterium]
MSRRLVLTLAVSVVVVAGLVPVLVMVGQSLAAEFHTGFAYYRGLLASGRAWTLAGHSLALSSITTLLTVGIGTPLGILLGKSDLPLRRSLLLLFAIPMAIPPYVLAVSWFNILGRGGTLAHWLGPALASHSSDWLFGLGGCVLVLATTFLPIVVLITVAQLSSIGPSYEEAARLTSGWTSTLWHVTLPLIAPGISLAAVVVFLLSLGEFGVPIFLRFDVFPVESFAQFSAFYNFGAATAAALPLGLVTFLLLFLEALFLRSRSYALRRGPDAQTMVIALKSRRTLLLVVLGIIALVLVVLPLGVLIVRSSTAGAFHEAIARGGASLVRSMAYAAAGATGLLLIGFLCGYLIQTRALPLWRKLDFLTVFLFTLPGPVIAIGLISLWNRSVTSFVYATPAIIILGYLAQYTALSSRMCASALEHVPPSMEEAAQVAGVHWGRRLVGIVVPLVRKGLVAAWIVGYVFCLRDTGMTMLVYPPGHDTLPVRTFTLMANGTPELIAALCILMVAAALLPLVILATTLRPTARMA